MHRLARWSDDAQAACAFEKVRPYCGSSSGNNAKSSTIFLPLISLPVFAITPVIVSKDGREGPHTRTHWVERETLNELAAVERRALRQLA